MPDSDIPILVIDDAKFSSTVIARLLRDGGYTDVRMTNNPLEGLRSIEKRPASIIITDWLTPGLTGAELTRRIRAIDRSHDHCSYVLLLTARDDHKLLNEAFNHSVDDFINNAQLATQLLPKLVAASTAIRRQNDMAHRNRELKRELEALQTTDLIDPVTGLGNLKFTEQRLTDLLTESSARGGVACVLLVGVSNFDVITEQYQTAAANELMASMSAKVRQLVRPLDLVTRPMQNTFAVTTLQDNLANCTSQSFSRVFDSLYMHSFRTSSGYIPVVVGVSIAAADASTGYPRAQEFLEFARLGLAKSYTSGTIEVRPFDPTLYQAAFYERHNAER